MNRHASVQLRRTVDEAVGLHYDAVFARLDRLVEGRCRCASCHERLLEHCTALLADLPPVRAVPEQR
jgi:hypothetical protein